MAGRRSCSQRSDGLDGNLLRWRGLTNSDCYCNSNSYCHAYGHANTDAHADGNIYSNSYCHAYGHANTDAHADSHSYSNSYCHAYGHANTDGNANGYCNSYSYCNAHGDGNINPMYGEVFTHTKASANSGAAPVAAGRADLSACLLAKTFGVVPRLRDEGG